MKVVGIVGWSGSGKTGLIVRLLPLLAQHGLRVSTIKHAHHAFDVDVPGKDSWEHRHAGATEVLVTSSHRWALIHELRGAAEPGLDEMLAKLAPVDLVLVEGFKAHRFAKIEVWRGKGEPLWPDDPQVIAIAAGEPLPERLQHREAPPILALDDTAAIAAFVLRHVVLAADPARPEPIGR